jgi:hypothetical protein
MLEVAPQDDEIAALYALPLGEFTAARNALAKRAGPRAAEVKSLVKPNIAAWAVNQLFWHRRPVFDALVEAAEAAQRAQLKQLNGETADLETPAARHRAALQQALAAATELLVSSGEAASPSTLQAVTQTLEALPSAEANGRLTRPLVSVGFGALAALLGAAGPGSRPGADVLAFRSSDRARTPSVDRGKGESAADKRRAEQARQAEEARRLRERLEVQVEAARVTEREADAALERARRAARQASDRVEALESEIRAARQQLQTLERAERHAEEACERARTRRERAERQLVGRG